MIHLSQSSLIDGCPITDAVALLSNAGIEERGAIFTRREVVDFILDLAGYAQGKPLHKLRLLEPSFGDGDFLLPAIERLLAAWRETGAPDPFDTLCDSIRAVELHRSTFQGTRERVMALLIGEGIAEPTAKRLAEKWLLYADYLLVDLPGSFDVVVGNPPYVRQELIPDVLMAEYRARYKTIYDRADIYIPFIERSLTILSKNGVLGFICADRWMKNRYGAPLRNLVASQFHLAAYIDMVGTQPFYSEVDAYPAITVIKRGSVGPTRIARSPELSRDNLASLSAAIGAIQVSSVKGDVQELSNVTAGPEPWILDTSDELALVRRLEQSLPTLEEAGCKVGIGVATGADQAFIAPFDQLDVEDDRKLPLVMTRDILSGSVNWRGFGVINPFADNGKLVDLNQYPKLSRHLEAHRHAIANRHVAQKAQANWYRTIDRIYPAIAKKEKLLIPDIKGEAHIVYEGGELYPHHNLYFITSETWDIRALQAVLMSGVARLFVAAYSTKMRGGFLRFQAQYLRRIRLPEWDGISKSLKKRLTNAAARGDVAACNAAVYELYNLSDAEQLALGGSVD
jgi:hypothetical protein